MHYQQNWDNFCGGCGQVLPKNPAPYICCLFAPNVNGLQQNFNFGQKIEDGGDVQGRLTHLRGDFPLPEGLMPGISSEQQAGLSPPPHAVPKKETANFMDVTYIYKYIYQGQHNVYASFRRKQILNARQTLK
ncbi:uncharacterized protein LOC131804714 isoform X1 [Musca domestica]|uniref:Uncharacterized protein LOC131804714 isoform X1 n=1 Tax=Musca domestica TaxID=7370 RepID=A0ABM3VDD2_MUSDO|nr:uncharacterized protein LOC131804714 isoform X1 [Musca domestica]